MKQLSLFGPCRLVQDIRAYVAAGKTGAAPVKHCGCTAPCWQRNGSNRQERAA